jgi:hypothetical protein
MPLPAPSYQRGKAHALHILAIICLLLLAREAYLTATLTKPITSNFERLWYPLAVLTEFLAVCLLAFPGLVPPRKDLNKFNAPEQVKVENEPV